MRLATSLGAIAALLLIGSAVAASKSSEPLQWKQEPESFMGIKFSNKMTYDFKQCPAIGEMPKEMCYISTVPNWFRMISTPDIGISPYSLEVKMQGSSVHYIHLTTAEYKFSILQELLIKKYGKPTTTQIETVKTKAGASFTNEKLIWQGVKTSMTLSKYDEDIETSSVLIVNKDASAEAAKENSGKLSDGASKL
jgi:hypothetical protein